MPNSPDDAAALFQGKCRFETSADQYAQLPILPMPEIAFAGRSNCGKSSLLNALMGSKNLARTSNTPGRTRLFNVFIARDQLALIDLPGYGFAKASKKDREHWQQQWQQYIDRRAALRLVFVLVDARRGLMPIDEQLMQSLDVAGVAYGIVLTKADKIPQPVGEALVSDIQETLREHPAARPHPILSSAKKRLGVAELRQTALDIVSS